jgi:hypothetical protein
MDVDCESVAWNILKNLLSSHSASGTIGRVFEILQQNSTVDAFCVVGALYFLRKTFVEDLYEFHGTAMMLNVCKM